MNQKTINVINGFVHQDYRHVVDLAHFYRQITTGQGYGQLIVNYKPRETDKQKQQRVNITQVRTKSIAGKIEGFFKRTFRPSKVKFEVTHKGAEGTANPVSPHIDTYGPDGQSLLTWSEEAALFYNNVDPNAFYWVKHSVKEGVDSFEPFVFSSKQVKDYEIDKGAIKWCVTKLKEVVEYSENSAIQEKVISIYYYFNKEGIELAIELDDDVLTKSTFYDQFKNEAGELDAPREVVSDTTYLVINIPSDTGVVPVSRMGYLYDKQTDGRTYVAFWDGASEEYKQLVNRGSEYDLSLTLHAFLQKISYYTPCDYQEDHKECRGGKLWPGKGDSICPSCNGSGKKIHTSSQDIIEIQLPTPDGEPVSVLPRDLVHYVELPTKIVEQQKEDVEEYDGKITKAVFGVDISNRKASDQATATAHRTYENTAQDALSDFTKAPRKLFLFTVHVASKEMNRDDVKAELLYPEKFDLETEASLIAMLKDATEAGVSAESIENIQDRIALKQNRSQTAEMNVFKAVRKFIPYGQVPTNILQAHILGLPDSSVQKALYLNSKEIATEIVNTNPAFLTRSYEQQRAEVMKIAQRFADELSQTTSVRGIAEMTTDDLEGIPSSDE